MSCPGVRIVVEIGRPAIRISRGSSPATTSGRDTKVPFSKRRIAVRTVTRLTVSACQHPALVNSNAMRAGISR